METNSRFTDKALKFFFIYVIALSLIFEIAYIIVGLDYIILGLMWVPAFGGIIAQIINMKAQGVPVTFKEHSARMGFKKCKPRYAFMGLLLPLIYLLIPYVIFWVIYPGSFSLSDMPVWAIVVNVLIYMVVGTAISMLSAIGEEIGWRGFMVPALCEKWGFKRMAICTSAFWCCWHLPILIWGGYMEGTATWFKIPAFILCIMPVGIMAAALTMESGSVWPAALLHAAHNNYDQAIFGPMTAAENQMYFVSETGVLTIICAWVLAIICIIRFSRKQQTN